MSSNARTPTGLQIGFVSTRFAGTDGVSLETLKWAAVLEHLGHSCCYFSGQSDFPPRAEPGGARGFLGAPAGGACPAGGL